MQVLVVPNFVFNICPILTLLTLEGQITVLVIEDLGVGLLQFGNDFLAMLYLHKWWLQRLDGQQYFFTECLTTHYFDGSLEYVVTKLVVN